MTRPLWGLVQHQRDAPSHPYRIVKYGSRAVTQEMQTNALDYILRELLVGAVGVLESYIVPFIP